MSARIEKIKDTYSTQFKERLEQEYVNISVNSAWDILISADPTKNKKNVRWLVETYLNDGFLWEDIASGPLSKVAETLVEFDKHKRNLEPADRSLTKYQTVGSLWASIKPYVGQMTPGEEKKAERDKAYSEAEVVVDREDGLKIVVPLTEYAAKWFGKGTRWCTSADNDNQFRNYAPDAPLFIIIMPNGDKLQLWSYDRSVQFMDENDVNIKLDYIENNWDILSNVILSLNLSRYIPRSKQTQEICESILNIDHNNFKYIDNKFKTPEMCERMVEKDGYLLQNVPHEFKTEKLCMTALKNNQNAFSYMPNKYKTQELCNFVMGIDREVGDSIKDDINHSLFIHIPDECKTMEM